jgi:hypothetical protein
LVTIHSNKVSTGIAIIVIVLIFLSTCHNAQAQTDITFNPADKFSIPAYNGTISFAVNGTYSKATFENGNWTFTNLCLTGSQSLENFEISTQNSNVTIFSYVTSNNTVVGAFSSVQLRYVVEGKGKQILNLGLGSEEGELEWSVNFHGHSIDEGDGWNILHDGTIVVTGATGNVSIVRYDYFESSSNLPFYQQHSVAIITAMIVAITVIIVIVIKVKNREHLNESELVKSA